MKILAVSALLCAMMALTAAAAVEKEEPEDEVAPAEELEVEKRTSCTDEWTWIGHRTFLYVSRLLTWDEAEKNCVSMGGHLASVHSKEEYDEIRNQFSKYIKGKSDTWIGGSDRRQEGVWQWSDGSRFDFRQWCSGEPNNLGSNQNCLHMVYSGFRCWDDLWCNERRPSLCVRKLSLADMCVCSKINLP